LPGEQAELCLTRVSSEGFAEGGAALLCGMHQPLHRASGVQKATSLASARAQLLPPAFQLLEELHVAKVLLPHSRRTVESGTAPLNV